MVLVCIVFLHVVFGLLKWKRTESEVRRREYSQYSYSRLQQRVVDGHKLRSENNSETR